MKDRDSKVYPAIKENVAEENLADTFRNEALKKNFHTVLLEIYNLSGIAIVKQFPVNE